MTVLHMRPGEYGEGSYGVVFFDESGFAIKVFKRKIDVPEEHVQATFKSEVAAYEIASKTIELRPYVPEFFGVVNCTKIFDATGNEISNEFYLSLSYKMKKIDGIFEKCGLQDDRLRAAFNSAGIFHTKDASVLFEDGAVKFVVDIAIEEHELWHQ